MDALRATLTRLLSSWQRPGQRLRELSSRSPGLSLLRGLSVNRIGLLLGICALLAWRRSIPCLVAGWCGEDEVQLLVNAAHFAVRNFMLALPMLVAVTVADNATTNSGTSMRVGALSSAVVAGAAVYGIGFLLSQPPALLEAMQRHHQLFFLTFFARALLLGGLGAALLYYVARERNDAQALQESKLAKLSLERQTTQARLQTLQAQIEPHFLFNTLANIRMLCDARSPEAKSLVRDLSSYLESAVPQIRDTTSTLGRELKLVEAYLAILRVRMGDRLRVVFTVPGNLNDASLPPMLLATLVENAVKHGINPRATGGTIWIGAERSGERLRVSVVDDGVGFRSGFGPGIGLANSRARLLALYGDAAHLELKANPGGGVIASIELPCRSARAEAIAT